MKKHSNLAFLAFALPQILFAQLGQDDSAGIIHLRGEVPSQDVELKDVSTSFEDKRQANDLTALERAQANLEASSESLTKSLKNYAGIYLLAQTRTQSGRNGFFFSTKGPYRKAQARAKQLNSDLISASNDLEEANRLILEMEKTVEPAWVLRQKSEWTRQVTLFNSLLEWSQARALKFNGPAWGDGEKQEILKAKTGLRAFALPKTPGNRESSILAPSQMEPTADRFLDRGLAMVERALKAREDLENFKVNRREVADRTAWGWTYLQYEDDDTFDRVTEPAAIQFSLACLQAKAYLNGAILAIEGPNRHTSESNHNRVRELARKLMPLAFYGDYRYLRVKGAWGRVTRESFVFEGANFRKKFWSQTNGKETKYLNDVKKYFSSKTDHLEVFLD